MVKLMLTTQLSLESLGIIKSVFDKILRVLLRLSFRFLRVKYCITNNNDNIDRAVVAELVRASIS